MDIKYTLDLNELEVSSFATEPVQADPATAAVAGDPIIVVSGPTVMTWCYVCPVRVEPLYAAPAEPVALAPRLY